MPPRPAQDPAAGAELCALLQELKQRCELSYDDLAAVAHMARNTVIAYVTQPDHRRGTRTLEQLLSVLGAEEDDRDRALQLHRRTRPSPPDPAEIGLTARAREASCTVWPMDKFTADEATVHTAIGRRPSHPHHDGGEVDAPPAYVPRAHDPALRADIAQAAAGPLQALIVVRGTSSTGKTRSLWEAVHALCPDWTVIRPR
ncbi:MAG: helix-turn-helix domain-containing protein, partial [Pseudonocardia sp.]|nr:helix-turn-helix domain-containing protein [Pseudonocardia sp.]